MFPTALQDGNPEVTNAQIRYYGVIGGDFKAGFSFDSPGTWKMFCREQCEGENILIKTTDVRAQTGRYSIEYKKESTYYVLSVSISKLTESDSGQYSCGLGGSSSSASYERFGVFVAEGEFLFQLWKCLVSVCEAKFEFSLTAADGLKKLKFVLL